MQAWGDARSAVQQQRKSDRDLGPLADFAVDVELPLMALSDMFDDREAEAGPAD